MKKMKILITLALTLLLTNAYARNCVFRPKIDCIERLKIYIDREGSIYPSSELYSFDQGRFYNPTLAGNDNTSKLSVYFKLDTEGMGKICESFGIDADFASMQKYLQKSYANKINSEVQLGKRIVFLIHGFNNSQEEAESSFHILKSKLCRFNDITVVEVYWDGLTRKPLNIWSKAQPNSVFAGFAIRNLLNEVDINADITFLTHSLGASVATNSLFNISKWKVGFQNQIDQLASTISTPPQKSITVAMFAPAIPGQNTFNDINRTIENNTAVNINKIIVGYNHCDIALTKGIGLGGNFGATSLGCNYKGEVEKTGKDLALLAPNIKYNTFDLSKKRKPKVHAVGNYVNAQYFEQFLDAAFIN